MSERVGPGALAYDVVAQSAESTVVAAYEPRPRTETGYQSEAELEAAFIATLVDQQYERLIVATEQDLIDNVRRQLERLNRITFSDKEWRTFFGTVIASASEGIVEKTRKIQTDRVQLLHRDDGTTKNVSLIDAANVHNNCLQVVNQYETGAGRYENRYDVTILVNGLPLVHVELKRRGVAVKEAFNQISRYQRDSFWSGAGLFQWVQIFVISNGTDTKYYANTTRQRHVTPDRRGHRAGDSYEFTMWWADARNRVIADLDDFSRTFFAKHTLLALLTRYCVLNSDNDLMVMRPYQIVATERILNKIRVATSYRKMGTLEAGGYVWHTTGSGKTLTSYKTAQLATELKVLDRVLFVVDRQDLDFKTQKDFNSYQDGCVSATVSTRKLREALADPAQRIVVTTIQKLTRLVARYPDHPVYAEHVALIFDECHRSQFGDMHTAIIKAFKRYHLFGFTGTPIFARNAAVGGRPDLKTTEQAFGPRLHEYTIVDASRDNTVLPFLIDYVASGRAADEIADEKVTDIDRERALLDQDRIAGIVAYILEHFDQKTKRGHAYRVKDRMADGFNSLFAVASIEAAKAYYSEFKRQLAASGRALSVGLIYSFAPNEEVEGLLPEEDFEATNLDASSRDFLESAIADYNRMFGTRYDTKGDHFRAYYVDVARRLENRELDLLIVVNMFLTGFDAKTLNTIWVDKKLRYHGLIQAFSRTNRILNSVKAYGQVVTFRNLEKATNDALALFGDSEASGLVILRPYAEYYAAYVEKMAMLLALYPLQDVLDDERGFVTLFGEILRLRNILAAFDEFTPDQWLMSERDRQDYQSRYLDLWAIYRPRTVDKEIINDDLVFEIELVKQVSVGLGTILALVQRYHDDNCRDKEIPTEIAKAVDSNPDLRSKKDLIEAFVATLNPGADVDAAWESYIDAARTRELEQIIAEEHLDPAKTRGFMANALRDGALPTTGTGVTNLLPPVSMFAPGNAYTLLKARVLRRLQDFYDRYAAL